MDHFTGKLPRELALGEDEVNRQASLVPFVQDWLADVGVDAVETQLGAVRERGDQAEIVAYFRAVQRANGWLNGQGAEWLARLAASQNS